MAFEREKRIRFDDLGFFNAKLWNVQNHTNKLVFFIYHENEMASVDQVFGLIRLCN